PHIARPLFGGERQPKQCLVGREVPGSDACCPQFAFGLLADATNVAEGVHQHGKDLAPKECRRLPLPKHEDSPVWTTLDSEPGVRLLKRVIAQANSVEGTRNALSREPLHRDWLALLAPIPQSPGQVFFCFPWVVPIKESPPTIRLDDPS